MIDNDDELAIFDLRRATIFCGGDDAHWWSTDDGHHWYREGSWGHGAGAQLETYEIVGHAVDEDCVDVEAQTPTPGIVGVTPEGAGFCPICASRLECASS